MATKGSVEQWSTVKNGGFKRHAPGIKSRRKHKKRCNNSTIIPVLNGSSNRNISFNHLKQKLLKEIESMKQTDLFKKLIINFKSISSSNYNLLCKIKQISNKSLTIKVNIICYGLGNFHKSLSSMHQISLLCSIINNLNNSNNDDYDNDDDKKQCDDFSFILNKVELFEPILTKIEKKVLRTFGIDILLNDTKGKYLMNNNDDNIITLCFMPHSPQFLYNNLLSTNWFNQYLLTKMYIIGNSFIQYQDLSISSISNKNKKDINWILNTQKLNIIKELDIDEWIKKKEKDKFIDSLERERLSITMNAFAFQKLLYFPVEQIVKYDTTKWINIYDKLVTETIKLHDQSQNDLF